MLKKPDDCPHNPAPLACDAGSDVAYCMQCKAEALYGPGARVFMCRPDDLGGEYGPPEADDE